MLPFFPTLVIGVITLVVWYLVTRWHQRKQYPPGPTPLPLIGNLREMMSQQVLQHLTEFHKQYGDVLTVFMANTPHIMLGSLEAVREAFLTKQNDYAGRPTFYSTDCFSKFGKDIVFGQFGPVWKQQRKIAHGAMRKFIQGDGLAKLVHQSFQKAAVELDKVADTGKKVKPKHNFDMTIYNIIVAMTFGKTHEHNDPTLKKFIKLMDDLNEVFGNGFVADFIPILKYIPTKSDRILHEAVDALFNMIEESYAEHVKNFDESKPKDIVDCMLQSIKEMEIEEGKESTAGLTLEHYQMIILDIFSAGTDTSRFTLSWAILYLTAFPECQKKIQEEVDNVVGRDVPPSMEHRPHLPYSEAFLHEILRIRPIVPLALPHLTTCDTSVGGYKIPAGTSVMPNLWAIHMNKNEWGDPEAFRPERFLDEDGKMGPRISSWLPFSTGRRVCVGEAIAKAELHLVLAAFAQRYTFHAPTGTLMDLRPKEIGQIMCPDDYEVVITKRV